MCTCGIFVFGTNAFLMGERILILMYISIHSIEVSSLLQTGSLIQMLKFKTIFPSIFFSVI